MWMEIDEVIWCKLNGLTLVLLLLSSSIFVVSSCHSLPTKIDILLILYAM